VTQTPPQAPSSPNDQTPSRTVRPRLTARRWFSIRTPTPHWQAILLGLACVAICFLVWWLVTRGPAEERIVSPVTLPSPQETLGAFYPSLWRDSALTRNVLTTLKRVVLGFALAVAVGVPLGVLAGCFSRIQAFLSPLIIFGRNIPLAALIPMTFFMFGIGETQKIMFIAIACVAFVVSDTATAISEVGMQYIDTAYTLGANRRQVILKVLVPLALPSVFQSMRLLFGLAFGYIMLAELVKFGNEAGGLGNLILTAQRRGLHEHIYLIVLIIPVIALAIDRLLFWVQRELFPYRYGGAGMLNEGVRFVLYRWDDFKGLFWKGQVPPDSASPQPQDPPDKPA
jgi:ABC-type nitrate/sulfonate/bicarbonate transport system permease component